MVLAAAGAVAALASVATWASLALLFTQSAARPVQYAAGDVTLSQDYTSSCTVTGISPGYSTQGYPGSLGTQGGAPCQVEVTYTGSVPAFLATDVSVTTEAGGDTLACNGGDASGTASCAPLYDPANGGTADPLEVFLESSTPGAGQSYGIGDDQTDTVPGTVDVDTAYTGTSAVGTAAECAAASGDDCPVLSGYTETYDAYFYLPQVQGQDQDVYQGASATVTITEHAVQAAGDPLFQCSPLVDSQGGSYEDPDQPEAGWSSGLSAGAGGAGPAVGQCPSIDATTDGTDWTASSPASELLPFYHPDS